MKQWIILILCLCLTVSGCTSATTLESRPAESQEAPITEPTLESNDPIETISPMEYSKPLTAISMIPYSEAVRHKSGATLYSWSSQNISLVMNDYGVAQVITLDFTNRDDRIIQAAVEDLAAANTDYTGHEDWIPYFCDIRYTPTRLDQIILSLAGNELLYDGTHRSGESTFAFNYDMQTGMYLSLRDILNPDYSADLLVSCILEALSGKSEDLFEDYTYSISSMFDSNAPIENWYFTENGLCFFFNPYEIAPQRKGVILAEIPYPQLVGILKDAYFPEEAVEYSGKLLMAEFDAAPTEDIPRYMEAVMDNGGNRYLIYVQGTVQNICVETGSWTKNGTFVPENTVFFAEALTEDIALILEMQPEHLGQLCITYQIGSNILQTPWQSN